MNITGGTVRRILPVLLTAALFIAALFVISDHEAYAASYRIKINRKTCLVTVYRKYGKKWKPYRKMWCACGKKSSPTPKGTFYISYKSRWVNMLTRDPKGIMSSYEQYVTRFCGQYYMHSCCYSSPDKNAEWTSNFNGLGKHKTHGCVRLSVMDAKWVYENCKAGTKVTVYDSKKVGALGKPKKIKVSRKRFKYWDPTDPSKENPYFLMKGAKFRIDSRKPKEILYGAKYKKARNLMWGVTAINPYANQDVTKKIRIVSLKRNGKKIKLSKYSTRKLGRYKVTYYVRSKYCTRSKKKGKKISFRFKVIDRSWISGARKRFVKRGRKINLVKGVTARSRKFSDLTPKIKVTVRRNGKIIKKNMSYKAAKHFTFKKNGKYRVIYKIRNAFPKTFVKKKVIFRVNKKGRPPVKKNKKKKA